MKPNLFIVGAMKSGTTSLHGYLSSHPQCFMSEPKEPGHFARADWLESIDEYNIIFKDYSGEAIVGEASTQYTKQPRISGVAPRIAKFNPEARIIYIMRDPVDRIVSHYWFNWRWHGERRNITDAVKQDSDYIDFGNYSMQIKSYIECFGLDRIHFMLMEDMAKNSKVELAKLYDWLKLKAYGDEVEERLNQTPMYVERSREWDMGLGELRKSKLWLNHMRPMVPGFVKRTARNFISESVNREEYARHEEELVRLVKPIILDQVNELSKITGREFEEWGTLYRNV